MSLYDYKKSQEILLTNPSFASLIMATAKKARIYNFGKLKELFPRITGEYEKRKHAPGGFLDGDKIQVTFESKGKVEKLKRTFRSM